MKSSSAHRQTKLEPFWNAILAGTVVSLIVLNILPSPKIQYLYRVKAVATQQRLDAFNDWLKKHSPKENVSSDTKSEGRIRFLAVDAIDTPRSSTAPVLSTNHALPERLLAQITFLSDKRFASDEIQKKLEEVSFTQCKAQEVQELERQVRMLEWQKTSAEHLANQLDASEASSMPLLTVSTNPVGNSTLLKDWKGIVEKRKQEHDQLIERLRTVTTKAHGFIAVAAKPEVFPRTTSPLSSSTIIAFALGVATSCLFFLCARRMQSGIGKRTAVAKTDRIQSKHANDNSDHGHQLAKRLAKLGIPILGNIAATGDRSNIAQMLFAAVSPGKALTDQYRESFREKVQVDRDLKSNSSPTISESATNFSSKEELRAIPNGSMGMWVASAHGQRLSVPLQRAIEWTLILWLAIGAFRFFTDDMWRGLFLHSPLTGIAKLLSGFA